MLFNWWWRRLLRVPWTARRSNLSILKGISPGCSLEGLMLKPKLQFWLPDAESWLIGKDPDAGRDWGQEEKGTTKDEMVGWHHRLNGREFEQTPGHNEGQGGPACPAGHKELDTTEWLNNSKESYCFYDLENTNIYSVKLLFRFFYFKWNNTECLIFRAS